MSDLATTHPAKRPSAVRGASRPDGEDGGGGASRRQQSQQSQQRKQSHLSCSSSEVASRSKDSPVPQTTDKKGWPRETPSLQQELAVREIKGRRLTIRLTEQEFNLLVREAREFPPGTIAWQIIRKYFGMPATLLERTKGGRR